MRPGAGGRPSVAICECGGEVDITTVSGTIQNRFGPKPAESRYVRSSSAHAYVLPAPKPTVPDAPAA